MQCPLWNSSEKYHCFQFSCCNIIHCEEDRESETNSSWLC